MIALGYGITYIWGTVGIILIGKNLPKWWGVDVRKAAKEYEEKFGVPNLDDVGLSGYRPAPRLPVGKPPNRRQEHRPVRQTTPSTASSTSCGARRRSGRVLTRSCRLGTWWPSAADWRTSPPTWVCWARSSRRQGPGHPPRPGGDPGYERGVVDKALKEFRQEDFAGQLQVVRMERGGVPFPVGAETKLQRFDVIFVAGLKARWRRRRRCWGGWPGRARRPTS